MNFTWGILAHVDAGKTTLSESILFNAKAIASLGRVDHGDAFLDTDMQEKNRGITIFSKPAVFSYGANEMTLLDTPGHVDFATETERALWALDGAILLISGTDGVQPHTRTLFSLLKKFQIPTIIFVNKMDMENAGADSLIANIKSELADNCVDLADKEAIASESEAAMEEYFETGSISDATVAELFNSRKIYQIQ